MCFYIDGVTAYLPPPANFMVLELFTKNLHDFKLLNVDALYPWIMYKKWGLIKHFFEHINQIHDTQKLPSSLYIRNFFSCGSLFKLFCCVSVWGYYLCSPVCVFGPCVTYTKYLDWWGFLLLGSLQNLATWRVDKLTNWIVLTCMKYCWNIVHWLLVSSHRLGA